MSRNKWSVTTPDLPGDFNHDGIVNAADYVVWRKTGGSPDDYHTWRTYFGRTLFTGSGSALPSAESTSPAVPEPYSLLLVIAFAMTIPLYRWAAKNRC